MTEALVPRVAHQDDTSVAQRVRDFARARGRSFNFVDARDHLSLPRTVLYDAIAYLCRKGELQRIMKGRWVCAPGGCEPHCVRVERECLEVRGRQREEAPRARAEERWAQLMGALRYRDDVCVRPPVFGWRR